MVACEATSLLAALSNTCPICGSSALLDLQPAAHNVPAQRGVQTYITSLEEELDAALHALETTLDILTNPANLEHSNGGYILRLSEEDMRKIAVAVGMPDGLMESNEFHTLHRAVLSFKKRESFRNPGRGGLERSLPHFRGQGTLP